VEDFCAPCGGADQHVCCDRQQCSNDPTDTACDGGLFRAIVQVEGFSIREEGEAAKCISEQTDNECGLTGQPPCHVEGDRLPCYNLATPSVDGTECVPCGKDGEKPCVDRFKMCTGSLVVLYGDNGVPETCFLPKEDLDVVADQSGGGDCGMAGLPWCTNSGPPCIGRSVTMANKTCEACGSVNQLMCSDNAPCDVDLRGYMGKCIACGTEGDQVCADPRSGPPCNEGLENDAGFCMSPKDAATPSTDGAVQDQSLSGGSADPGEACGLENAAPCPGQPACATDLFLVIEDGVLTCSSVQPSASTSHSVCFDVFRRHHFGGTHFEYQHLVMNLSEASSYGHAAPTWQTCLQRMLTLTGKTVAVPASPFATRSPFARTVPTPSSQKVSASQRGPKRSTVVA
jgi:hypothetical protein